MKKNDVFFKKKSRAVYWHVYEGLCVLFLNVYVSPPGVLTISFYSFERIMNVLVISYSYYGCFPTSLVAECQHTESVSGFVLLFSLIYFIGQFESDFFCPVHLVLIFLPKSFLVFFQAGRLLWVKCRYFLLIFKLL